MTQATEWLKQMNWRQCAYPFGEPAHGLVEELRLRDKFIAKFGFAILSDDAVSALLPLSPFVEVGAGSGYWSYELIRAGAQSVAADPQTGTYYFGNGHTNWVDSPYVPIERLTGVDAVDKYPDHTLLTVWPDMATWPAETLARYKGAMVAYVGESSGGCTADDDFHRILEESFFTVQEIAIPQFWGVHDFLSIWKRKPHRRIVL